MKTKRIIACIISFILFTVFIPFTTTAKVIEPEVVKTEKWTTSYYIDDDIDTLYPYIQCEADIYNDGTIKLYMWNAHEWDGFATVSHKVTLANTYLYSTDSPQFVSKFGGTALINNKECHCQSSQNMDSIDISYYDSLYSLDNDNWTLYYVCNSSPSFYEISKVTALDAYSGWTFSVDVPRWSIAMSKIPYRNSRKEKYIDCSTLRPRVDPTGTYNFRLFGHDITITPELLSGNIVATPSDDGYKTITYNNGSSASKIKTDTDVSDIQEYIDKLEAENALLRQENTELKNRINLLATGTYGDVNGDQVVDVQDAQIILAYYTERDVAKKSVPDLVTFGLNFGKE